MGDMNLYAHDHWWIRDGFTLRVEGDEIEADPDDYGLYLEFNIPEMDDVLAMCDVWEEIEDSLPGVAEGAYTVDAALALADRLGVEMPIAREVHRALFEGKGVMRCLVDLLSREQKDELVDFRAWVRSVGGAGPSS